MQSSNFISSSKKLFSYYKHLGEKTFDQLSEQQLLDKPTNESNSIAIIVNHLWGNMKSRWTDFLTTDGEKSWRKRDQEFEEVIQTKEELIEKWNEGWACLFEALNTLDEENFSQTIYIRNQGHTILEAIHRQLAHYAYHVGQIVHLGKMHSGSGWRSLSIPKGKSSEYNQMKFDEVKNKAHFTDEFLSGKNS